MVHFYLFENEQYDEDLLCAENAVVLETRLERLGGVIKLHGAIRESSCEHTERTPLAALTERAPGNGGKPLIHCQGPDRFHRFARLTCCD